MQIHLYIYIYIHIYTCTYLTIHTYIYVHIHIRIHTSYNTVDVYSVFSILCRGPEVGDLVAAEAGVPRPAGGRQWESVPQAPGSGLCIVRA